MISWGMRTKPPRVAQGVKLDGAGFYGPLCDPGTYTVKITKGEKTIQGDLVLVADPASPHSKEDLSLRKKMVTELFTMSEDLAFLNQQILSEKSNAFQFKKNCKNSGIMKKLNQNLADLEKIRTELVATKGGEAITGEEKIRERLSELYASVNSYEGRPSESQLDRNTSH